jgi:alanine dehydrogenase
MNVGVVTEIKPAEQRVALTPAGARELVADGHQVLVQCGAGDGSGFADAAYAAAGATIGSQAEVWERSDLLVKVKEPIAEEYGFLRRDQVLFTYLHLAADRALTDALVSAGTCAIAYETVEDAEHRLPLLAPMSEIAGRLAALAGAFHLQGPHGGRGLLIGGAPGVAPARVLVLGGGTAGTHAARAAVGMGAQVTILERSLARIRQLEEFFDGRAQVLMSDAETIKSYGRHADLLIGAVLVPGASAPRLITREILRSMADGSVLVDVAIDQGGCADTSRPTTHGDPTYVVDGIVHYCVGNLPGAVASTSTRALTNATLPYVRTLAAFGVDDAIAADAGLAAGVNVRDGEIVCAPVADAHELAVAAA